MKSTKQKRRKRPQASNPVGKGLPANEEDEAGKVLNTLEAFSLASTDDSVSANREANGDPDKEAEIVGSSLGENAEEPSTSSSSGSSTSGYSEGFVETGRVQNVVHGRGFRGTKQKRLIAATGTVSTVLGKEYVNPSPPRKDSIKSKRFNNGAIEKQEAEQFLCSMLGDKCELSMAVVRDVLCEYPQQFCFRKFLWLFFQTLLFFFFFPRIIYKFWWRGNGCLFKIK